MTPLARLGLVGAALALPLGAVVVSYVSGADPGPNAPVEVRIGGPGDRPGDYPGEAVRPSPVSARVPVTVGQPAEIMTAPEPVPPPQTAAVTETVVPALPPVVADGEQPSAGKGAAKSKGKSKSDNGANPPGRTRASAGNG
jgi:hypothetical protein